MITTEAHVKYKFSICAIYNTTVYYVLFLPFEHNWDLKLEMSFATHLKVLLGSKELNSSIIASSYE